MTTYRSWVAMRQRCYNPNNDRFDHYGGRGIRVCDRWMASYDNFLADMGECPPGLSLDRFPDPNGNYEPSNCRWATDTEQNNNRTIIPKGSEVGTRYGKMVILNMEDERAAGGKILVKCQCDCGNTKVVFLNNLRRGVTKTCGCSKLR